MKAAGRLAWIWVADEPDRAGPGASYSGAEEVVLELGEAGPLRGGREGIFRGSPGRPDRGDGLDVLQLLPTILASSPSFSWACSLISLVRIWDFSSAWSCLRAFRVTLTM